MKVKVLAKVIGENATVGLIGLLFGDEGKIDLAEQLDSERLLSAVNSEANMDVRLKKASVLISALKTTREKLLKSAQKAAKEHGEVAAVPYAAQIADLDGNIATLQVSVNKMVAGRADAAKIVNKIQTQVHTNLVKDQITLTKKEFNSILAQQVEFTSDMIDALPSSNVGSKMRKSVEKKVENDGMFAESKMDILQRLMKNQADAPDADGVLDEAGEAVLAEILGKK